MGEITILGATGHVGNGVYEDSIQRAIENHEIDFIGVDSGSIDKGPGSYVDFTGREGIKRDWRILLKARDEIDVPLVTGSAGGVGTNDHVDEVSELLREIAEEEGLEFDLAKVYTGVDGEIVREKIQTGDVRELGMKRELETNDVDESERIVAQIGPEPFVEAIDDGADVVLAGRALDTSIFSAIPIERGFDRALSVHLAKLLECGAGGADPKSGADCLVGHLSGDHFDVVPPNPERVCTTSSVTTAFLHEKSNPNVIHVPAGEVDISDMKLEQIDDRTVRVSGSEFVRTDPYSVCIEGVKRTGYRSLFIFGVRDKPLLSNIDSALQNVQSRLREVSDVPEYDYVVTVRKYGVDGVPLFDLPDSNPDVPGEICVLIDIVSDTQERANALMEDYRHALLHINYEGKQNIGAQGAFPFSKTHIEMGPVHEFSIHHLIDDVDPLGLSVRETEVIG